MRQVYKKNYVCQKHRDVIGIGLNAQMCLKTEILISYQRAINSWAKTKYIPDLYSTGYIHDKLSSFTGSFEATKKKYDMTQNIYAIVQKLKRAYEDILRLQFPENEKALFEKVKSDISVLGEWLCIIREIGSLVASGSDIERDNFEKNLNLIVILRS